MPVIRRGVTRYGQTITGLIEVERALFNLQRVPVTHVAQALRLEGERIMARSKDEFVPVVTGLLKSSGRVHPVREEGNSLVCRLTYGNSAARYALAVHEAPPSRGQGRCKYLEKPVLEAMQGFPSRMAAWAKVLR